MNRNPPRSRPIVKRIAQSLLPFALVPCTFAFVLTAMPARLYAESAPPPPLPPECTSSAFTACADASAAAACTVNGFAGTCLNRICIDDAGAGTTASRLACVPSPTTPPTGSTTPPTGSTTPPTGSTTPPASSSSARTTPNSAPDEAGGCSIGAAPLDVGGALSGVAFLTVLGAMLAKRRARLA